MISCEYHNTRQTWLWEKEQKKNKMCFSQGTGGENQKRTGQKVPSVFSSTVFLKTTSAGLQGCTDKVLPELPAEHLCQNEERACKIRLGNSLYCRHLMDYLLENRVIKEQACDFVFQLLKNTVWALVKATQPCSMAFLFSQVHASYIHTWGMTLQISYLTTPFVHCPGVFLGSWWEKHEGCFTTIRENSR